MNSDRQEERQAPGDPPPPREELVNLGRLLLLLAPIIFCGLAIAIPNTHDPSKRSKVSRVKSDMRTMRTAIEAYAVDWNAYPIPGPVLVSTQEMQEKVEYFSLPTSITTPIQYLSKHPVDVFQMNKDGVARSRVLYIYLTSSYLKSVLDSGKTELSLPETPGWTLHVPNKEAIEAFDRHFGAYVMWSCGPAGPGQWRRDVPFFLAYDPTNGEKSTGHIFITQKSSDVKYVPVENFPLKFPFKEAGTLPPLRPVGIARRIWPWLAGVGLVTILLVIWWAYRGTRNLPPPVGEGELR